MTLESVNLKFRLTFTVDVFIGLSDRNEMIRNHKIRIACVSNFQRQELEVLMVRNLKQLRTSLIPKRKSNELH